MFYSKETFRDDSLRYNDKESWLKEGSLTLKKKQRLDMGQALRNTTLTRRPVTS